MGLLGGKKYWAKESFFQVKYCTTAKNIEKMTLKPIIAQAI